MDGSLPSGFSDALALLDRRIEREILRLRARYELSLDEFRGLYVSDAQVDALVTASAGGGSPPANEPTAPIAATLPLGARWNRVAETFGLSALEQDVLLLALAPEIDLKYETLYAYLNNDVTRKWPTLDLARRLLASSASGLVPVAAAVRPESKLRVQGLIDVIEPPGARPTQLNLGFALRACVSRFLIGLPLTPTSMSPPASSAADWDPLPFAPAIRKRLQGIVRLLESQKSERPVLALVGVRGSGREAAACALARALRLPLRRIDFQDTHCAGIPPRTAIDALALELRLEPAALCVCGIDTLFDREGNLQTEARGLLSRLDVCDAPVFVVTSSDTTWRGIVGRRRVLTIDFPNADYAHRLHLWRSALKAADIVVAPRESAAMADRFQLAPAQILDAVRAAQDWACAASETAVTIERLRTAARAQSHALAHGLATKIRTTAGWDDLVLPANVHERLHELSAAIQHRHVVYAEWGFARCAAGGTGVKALFAGASGTGKTMAAGVIARELGLDLYRIDLAGVVSKYIGETEKNLDRIFEAARGASAVLFFDEADAVFGKRSEVKDAHDRYANIEVAYLLQKLEDHDGIVILASNLKRNIDEAFSRRLHYVVDFPKPDAELRERIWRGMFPRAAPLDQDIDFTFLARQFELAGGDIRNVVLDAAFLAAQDGAIGMRRIVQALARQMAKQGKAPSATDFGRYFPLSLGIPDNRDARP